MFRLNIMVILGTLFLSTLFSYLNNHSFNQLSWINTLFNCSLFLTVIGGVMIVIQGGFFNGIVRSFRLFFRKTNRIEQILEEIEGEKGNFIPYHITFGLTFPFLISGTILLLFSILLSLNFY
jgi:hypothetical protein